MNITLYAMPQITFAPSLGWPVGAMIAALMLCFAVITAVRHVRMRGESDETATACARRIALCVTIAIMALTPSITSQTVSQAVNATDVVIAVDVTGSMAVSDAQYGSSQTISRLDAAKKAVDDITGLYPDASFMGLRFGSTGTVDVPLTPDSHAIGNWANTLAVEETGTSGGSSLDAPLDRLLISLRTIRQSHPDDAIILYLITDGEQTGSTQRRSYSTLRKYLDDGFAVAVGSEQGGRIPVIRSNVGDSGTSDEWVIDPDTGQPGISRMDKANMSAIADEISGSFIALDDTTTMASGVSRQRSSQWQVSTGVKRRTRVTPVVWPFAIVALALLSWEAGSWIALSRRLL